MFSSIRIPLIAFMISTSASAGCVNPVTVLKAGDKAVCDGFLFSAEKELELRTMNEDYKLLQEQTKLYIQQKELFKQELDQSSIIVQKEQEKAEKWRQAAETSTQKLVQQEETRGMRDWLFLGAGIALTLGASWGAGQVTHK